MRFALVSLLKFTSGDLNPFGNEGLFIHQIRRKTDLEMAQKTISLRDEPRQEACKTCKQGFAVLCDCLDKINTKEDNKHF